MAKPRRFVSALSIGCAVLVASPSWAAIVEPGYGDLTINQGHGFKPVTARAQANVGDSVMVGPGGAATIAYDDGCKVNVGPGAVTTIAPISPCASGSNAQDQQWTPQTIAFWLAFLGMGAFIGYEISRPSSP
jgi:hypothetical protein